MPYAIIHTATRVIRRITTDDPPPVAADETAVVVPDGTDIGRRDNGDGTFTYKKLDGRNALVDATAQEALDAEVDEPAVRTRERQQTDQSIDAMLADPSVPQTVKDVLQRITNR